jgi:hypothetical protein
MIRSGDHFVAGERGALRLDELLRVCLERALIGSRVNLAYLRGNNGPQMHSFCCVDEFIDRLIRLMASGDDITGPINS